QQQVPVQVVDRTLECRVAPSSCEDVIGNGIVQDDLLNAVAHRATLARRAVDGNEERRAEADIGVIGQDIEFLAGSAERCARLVNRDAAIELGQVTIAWSEPIASASG